MKIKNYIFASIRPDYRKRCFDIVLRLEGKNNKKRYLMPFACFQDLKISSINRVKTLKIDTSSGGCAVFLKLMDGSKYDFHSDSVLYHCEPSYEWSALNQIKGFLKKKLTHSNLSMRVVADALKTSPTQVVRLLQSSKTSKQWLQLRHLAKLAGYELEVRLKKVA